MGDLSKYITIILPSMYRCMVHQKERERKKAEKTPPNFNT